MLRLTRSGLTLWRRANVQSSPEQLAVTPKNWPNFTISWQLAQVICRLYLTLLFDGLYCFVSFVFSGENNKICWSAKHFASCKHLSCFTGWACIFVLTYLCRSQLGTYISGNKLLFCLVTIALLFHDFST